MIRSLCTAALLAGAAQAFAPASLAAARTTRTLRLRAHDVYRSPASFDPAALATPAAAAAPAAPGPAALAASAATAAWLALPADALAKGGEYGLLEGKSISSLHPLAMGTLYLASLGSLYTGFQWRRTRTMADEITEAKRAVKGPADQLAALDAAAEADPSAADGVAQATLRRSVADLQVTVDELVATRKELASSGFRDRHHSIGSALLGFGVLFAVEGPVNTYLRAGKLFPGPHLYAGAGVCVLWALSASLTPKMQKGEDWARNAHIALNSANLGLFTYYQIPTGWGIWQKVIEKAPWP